MSDPQSFGAIATRGRATADVDPAKAARWQEWVRKTHAAQRAKVFVTDAFTRDDYPGSDAGWEAIVKVEQRCRRGMPNSAPARRETVAEPKRIPVDMRRRTVDELDCRGGVLDDGTRWSQEQALDAAARFVAEFGERTQGLLLLGPTGTGKTSIAAAIAVSCGKPFGYWTVRDIGQARSDEISEGGASRIARTLSETALLVIDDLGAGRQHDYVLEVVREIVARRHDLQLPTVVTSNLTPKLLTDLFADDGRTWSRLRGMSERVVLVAPDQRLAEVAG